MKIGLELSHCCPLKGPPSAMAYHELPKPSMFVGYIMLYPIVLMVKIFVTKGYEQQNMGYNMVKETKMMQ